MLPPRGTLSWAERRDGTDRPGQPSRRPEQHDACRPTKSCPSVDCWHLPQCANPARGNHSMVPNGSPGSTPAGVQGRWRCPRFLTSVLPQRWSRPTLSPLQRTPLPVFSGGGVMPQHSGSASAPSACATCAKCIRQSATARSRRPSARSASVTMTVRDRVGDASRHHRSESLNVRHRRPGCRGRTEPTPVT